MGITGTVLLFYPSIQGFWTGVWNSLSEGEFNNGTLRNIGLLFTGFAGLFATYTTILRIKVAQEQADAAQRQAFTAQEGLANDRYQKGAEMLGSDVLSVRVGGIYVLQSLVADVPSIYTIPVKRLLCAFIRNPTSDPSLVVNSGDNIADGNIPLLRDDVKAAVEAVTVRNVNEIKREQAARIMHDIVHADLQGMFLLYANFANFNLSGAELNRSVLVNASFKNTFLTFANLTGVELGGSDFDNARLHRCNVTGAKFVSESYSAESIRTLIFAKNLTQAQLDHAVADPDNPPILDGVVDAETGEQLVWRGSAPST